MGMDCGSCTGTKGCTERLDDARVDEEVNSAPYLLLAAFVIVVASLAARWLFS